MSAEKAYEPWDMKPANEAQCRYLANLAGRLQDADWSSLDTTQASACIEKLNAVRQAVGIGFAPFDG